MFVNPRLLEHRLATNLFEHFSQIEGEITEAVSDFKNKDYFKFGDAIGATLVYTVGSDDNSNFGSFNIDDVV